MRSVFIRIFAAFWLTSALAMFAGTLVYWTAPPRPDVRRIVGELMRTRAADAASAVDAGDREAADATLHELSELGGPDVALVEDGRRVAGDAPPMDVARLASLLARASAEHTAVTDTIDDVEMIAAPLGAPHEGVVAVARVPVLGGRFPIALAVRLVALFFLSGFVSYLLARWIAAPIQAVRGAARELAAGGASVRVSASVAGRKDEVAALAHDFDRMAERIEALLAAQSRLLLDVSHELRSPLARLTVALELARQRSGPDATAALERIEREAERLTELVSEVLTLSRLEHGNAKHRSEPVALDALVRAIAADADFEAGSARVEVGGDTLGVVAGDEELLRRAIENVVRNAVRHAPEGTGVEVTKRRDGARAHIEVRDHGPGVPEAELAEIFRPFYRVGVARERAGGGTGLGLAITERAIARHDGRVTAENAPGGGLLVRVTLPAPKDLPARELPSPVPALAD